MLTGIYLMDSKFFNDVYKPSTRKILEENINIFLPPLTKKNYLKYADQLSEIDFIFSGWGAPVLDKEFLDLMPDLKVIFYAAGTMKHILTDEVWKRGIRVTTANVANSIPVAEFVLAEILFSLKDGWQLSRKAREDKTLTNGLLLPIKGIYKSTVGIVSMSQIGRRVIELLKPFDVEIIAYDPYVSQTDVDCLNVKMCSLEEVFKKSDIVSLHTPLLPETTGMITKELFSSLKNGATFINTARGAIVDELGMIEVLKRRPDLTALLDVTNPEPPVSESPLYTLPNVILTPHIAGSVGNEKSRLGDFMLNEFNQYLKDDTLNYEITKDSYQIMA